MLRDALDAHDPMALAAVAMLIDNGFGAHFEGLDAPGLLLRPLSMGEPGVVSVVATTASEQQFAPETVRALQEALVESGHCASDVDGTFNPMFIRALDAFARSSSSLTDG